MKQITEEQLEIISQSLGLLKSMIVAGESPSVKSEKITAKALIVLAEIKMSDDRMSIGFPYEFKALHSKEGMFENEVKANKHLRKNLDVQLQNLKECPPSRERSLAITKLQEGIMWLGMDLKRLNTENPYPDSYNPDNTKIVLPSDNLKL